MLIEGQTEFEKYLVELAASKEKKPFDCLFLAVLPEETHYRRSDAWPTKRYIAGSLLCCEKTGVSVTHCSIEGKEQVLNEEGKLVIPCSFNGSEFTFLLAGFEPKK